MTDPWPLRSSLELGALPTAVPCACVHTQLLLWEWGLNSLAESAELPTAVAVAPRAKVLARGAGRHCRAPGLGPHPAGKESGR